MAPVKAAVLCLAVMAATGLRHVEDLIDTIDIDHEAEIHQHQFTDQKAHAKAHHKAHGKHRSKAHRAKLSRRFQTFLKLAAEPTVAPMDTYTCPALKPDDFEVTLEPGVESMPRLESCKLKSGSPVDARCCMRADPDLASRATCPKGMWPKSCAIDPIPSMTGLVEQSEARGDFDCSGNLLVLEVGQGRSVAVRFLDMHSLLNPNAGLPKLTSLTRDDTGSVVIEMKNHYLNIRVFNADGSHQDFNSGYKLVITATEGKSPTVDAKYYYNQGFISKGFHFLTRSSYDGTGTYRAYSPRSEDLANCKDKSIRDVEVKDEYDMPKPVYTDDDDDWGSSSDDDWDYHGNDDHDDSFDNEPADNEPADSFDSEPADTNDNDDDDYDIPEPEGFTGSGFGW